MKSKNKAPFSNLKFNHWKNLTLLVIICFSTIYVFLYFRNGSVGGDYLAFWSVGKIADEKGYPEIYNISELRIVQQQIFVESGDWAKNDSFSFFPTPVPYFSVFITPFQLLSRISVVSGYRIWTILNLTLLIGYLFFFLRKTNPRNDALVPDLTLLIPFLISYPVFFNITCGQVEVFVLICAGEFIRQAGNKKPILSGFWLGGLLLKPQLLILIIPIFIIMRYWKTLVGLSISSGLILLGSLLLSGQAGMRELINLWTKYSAGIATSAPEIMINWRMVGVNLNLFINSSLGWVITSLGMALTIVAVFQLFRHLPTYGSPSWVLAMLGVFSATLAITWHSHYHMAMVMIPFLIYASVNKLLFEKMILLWCIVTPVGFLGTILFEIFFFGLLRISPLNFHNIVVAFIGLISNLSILFLIIQYKKKEILLRINSF